MKRLWIAVGILAVLLAGTLGNAWYARAFTEQLTGQLREAQEQASKGDWERAASLSQKVFQSWQSHRAYLHVLMRHSDADQILCSFRALEQYLALEEPDQYTAANAELITQLELLSEMEQPSWINIF